MHELSLSVLKIFAASAFFHCLASLKNMQHIGAMSFERYNTAIRGGIWVILHIPRNIFIA